MVIDFNVYEDGIPVQHIIVDPGYANRWKEEPWHSEIRQMASRNIAVGIKTEVIVGTRGWSIYPDRDVPAPVR